MRIECKGHSRFLITLQSGYRIVTDPFDSSTGYPVGHVEADTVLVSHHHHDHDAVDTVSGYEMVIDTPGVHTIAEGVRVTGVPTWHDAESGRQRGANLVFVLEAEGLRLVHLGDLGHLLREEDTSAIGTPDILMIPVGGHFTIDASQAVEVCRQLQPRIVLPMHYKTAYNSGWPISGPEKFLTLFQEETGTAPETLDLLRVTREDLACQPGLVMLSPQL